jgi:butyryl-CoA dehydrogenase
MDFGLSDEQKLFKRTFADFSDEVVAPGAADRDEKEEFDLDCWRKMADLGLAGLIVSEEYGGTDAGAFVYAMTAVQDGNEYILNGTKIFITNAYYADIYVVLVRTGDKNSKHGNSSYFVVEKGTPGFSFGKKEKKMGIRASSTYELVFENCRVPKENLLGNEGDGFKQTMHVLNGGRVGIASQALGIAEGAYRFALAFAQERQQFGKPIFAKCYAADVAMEVTTEAVQVLGGYGYSREYPVERMMRDAKITQIYEGTNEIQRLTITGCLKKGDISNYDS